MPKFEVVMSDLRFPDAAIETELLQSFGCRLKVCNCDTEDKLIKECENADAILLNLAPCSRNVIDNLANCKVISRYGVGYDNVDVQACTDRGIVVTNVPDYCAEDVSDMAVALILACIRRVAMKDRLIREGKWNINANHMMRLEGKTLSLIGFGRIGHALVRKLKGFNLSKIYIYDPFVSEETILECGAIKTNLEEALREGDIVSLHLPLNSETRGIIGFDELALMKQSAILINTSRGALVDESALIKALKEGDIAGAGLDTFNIEPIESNNELLKLDNCVLTDHSGFNTEEAVEELRIKATQNVVDVLIGKKPKYGINISAIAGLV